VDTSIPSFQDFSSLPLALKEIEKLHRLKESLLDAYYETKQQNTLLTTTLEEEKETFLEFKTKQEILEENNHLEILRLKSQIKAICHSEGNLSEIYNIFNKDITRLLNENEQLRKQVTIYELNELSSIGNVSSSVLHPSLSEGKRLSRKERGEDTRVNFEGEQVMRSRSLSSHQSLSSSPEPRVPPSSLPLSTAVSSSSKPPSASATASLPPTSSYEYQKLLKKYRQLLFKLKQCSQEKASYKSLYEQLKTKERQFILSDKMSSDISQRNKKLTSEIQTMKRSTEQRSSLILEISTENEQLKQEIKQLKSKQNDLSEENTRYLSTLQSQKKLISELSNEKNRILLFHQFLYKHNHNIHQQRSTSPYKEVYQHFVEQQQQHERRKTESQKERQEKYRDNTTGSRRESEKEASRSKMQNSHNSDGEEEIEEKLHNEVSQVHLEGDYQEWLKHHFSDLPSPSRISPSRTAPPFSRLMYDEVDHRGYSSRVPLSSSLSSGVKFCPLPPPPSTISLNSDNGGKDPFKQFKNLKSSLPSLPKT
jgi:hypothetical protein